MDIETYTLIATAIITFVQVVAAAYKKLKEAIEEATKKR